MNIFLVSNNHAKWSDFNTEITNSGAQIHKMDSLENAQENMKKQAPSLIILDLDMEGKAMRDAVISLLTINASVHSVVVSSMGAEEFHEFTEGLGILMSLPVTPTVENAKDVLSVLSDLE